MQDINMNTLDEIMKIKMKKYKYVNDNRNVNNLDTIGFSSKQINEVMPNAIRTHNEIIPNINIYGTYNKNKIILSQEIDNSLDIVNKNIEIERNNIKEIYTVVSYNNMTIEVNRQIGKGEIGNCYIKGTEINDYEGVDKNYIYTLNVNATQNLYKMLLEQQQVINNLQNRINILENGN